MAISQDKTNSVDVDAYIRKMMSNAVILEIIEQRYYSDNEYYKNSNAIDIYNNTSDETCDKEISFNRNIILSSFDPKITITDTVFAKTVPYKDRFLTLVLYDDSASKKINISIPAGNLVIVSVI